MDLAKQERFVIHESLALEVGYLDVNKNKKGTRYMGTGAPSDS